jgi:predicted phosphodiesterase
MNTQENKNNTIIIGDIHGRSLWKIIAQRHPDDEIILVGDYFDSKEEYDAHAQIKNFNEIIAFKRANPNRVTLLFGNHDFHYLPAAGEKYSGYQYFFAVDIYDAMKPALDEKLLKICIQKGKFLVSHAGLTQTWCRQNNIPLSNPVETVNQLFYDKPEAFRFSAGELDEPTGDEPEQGPLWVRPYSLSLDCLPDFTHVVGHTQQADISILPHTICVDVLAFTPKYLEINAKGEATARYFA